MTAFPKHPRKLLIRSTNWIGDAVMTTPALRSIRAFYPDTEITLLAHPWVADVFRASPRIDRIITYDKHGMHRGVAGIIKLGLGLRHQGFAAAILLQNAFEAAVIARLAGIPARGGFTTDGRGLLLSHGIARPKEHRHTHQVHYYQALVQGLGIPPGSNELELFLPAQETQAAAAAVAALRAGYGRSGPVVGLNPGAAYGPAKRWPAAQFAALAGLVIEEMDGSVVIFGTGTDHAAAAEIGANLPASRVLDLTGRTTLLAAMAHIDQCDCFVTNDSGLMHVAAALHRPSVAIFGSTNPVTTGPFSNNAAVIREELDCSPCLKPECPEKHFNCMVRITPEKVLATLYRCLEEV
ncbi:MAG: lipopolysaccharide heptosyltransferase II [Desulfobulbus propionicus]|nr:MAG: lipopolysaccharide heptosyltransferase II [Desulfobulbus propionicus]